MQANPRQAVLHGWGDCLGGQENVSFSVQGRVGIKLLIWEIRQVRFLELIRDPVIVLCEPDPCIFVVFLHSDQSASRNACFTVSARCQLAEIFWVSDKEDLWMRYLQGVHNLIVRQLNSISIVQQDNRIVTSWYIVLVWSLYVLFLPNSSGTNSYYIGIIWWFGEDIYPYLRAIWEIDISLYYCHLP